MTKAHIGRHRAKLAPDPKKRRQDPPMPLTLADLAGYIDRDLDTDLALLKSL
ncbi:hypothetical protein [Actinoplanes solisilvae]|uniref:hypothetical protein n=1 Tax=Actinoplanes solisilvae TaxID=2486853 RepID=UPI0013E3D253|nr:hypothetical protein [Actinoplanes solisilvae]